MKAGGLFTKVCWKEGGTVTGKINTVGLRTFLTAKRGFGLCAGLFFTEAAATRTVTLWRVDAVPLWGAVRSRETETGWAEPRGRVPAAGLTVKKSSAVVVTLKVTGASELLVMLKVSVLGRSGP